MYGQAPAQGRESTVCVLRDSAPPRTEPLTTARLSTSGDSAHPDRRSSPASSPISAHAGARVLVNVHAVCAGRTRPGSPRTRHHDRREDLPTLPSRPGHKQRAAERGEPPTLPAPTTIVRRARPSPPAVGGDVKLIISTRYDELSYPRLHPVGAIPIRQANLRASAAAESGNSTRNKPMTVSRAHTLVRTCWAASCSTRNSAVNPSSRVLRSVARPRP